MIDRYPAPQAEYWFGENTKIGLWTEVAMANAAAEAAADSNGEAAKYFHENRHMRIDPMSVRTREQETRHDVVAFLSVLEQQINPKYVRYLHYGRTSSDIVDTAHFHALSRHTGILSGRISALCFAVTDGLIDTEAPAPAMGRTHGQIAEVTTWSHRFHVWNEVLKGLYTEFREMRSDLNIAKSAGPTGCNINAVSVATFNGSRVVPSTQVIPRDYQVRWATLYLRLAGHLENFALLVRAGSHWSCGEVTEGGSRVGSSAMAHKRNPITSEKLCGLARVARGHFLAVAESAALWDDRDISNSSVERTAVVDLAGTVEYMLDATLGMVASLQIDHERAKDNLSKAGILAHMNTAQMALQDTLGYGPVQAGAFLRRATEGVAQPEKYFGAIYDAIVKIKGGNAAHLWNDRFNALRHRQLADT